MSKQLQRASSCDTAEPDSQIGSLRERPKFMVKHSGWIFLGGGFGILVLLVFITGLAVVSRATLLFREVSTINIGFQRVSLDLERLRSDMFLAGNYVRDQLVDSESDLDEDRPNQFRKSRSTVETRLNSISETVAPDQRAEFGQLREEIEAYWKFVEPVFSSPLGETRSTRELRRGLATRRESALALAAASGFINERAVQQRLHAIDTAECDPIQHTWATT